MKTYIAVFAALLAASTSSLLSAPAIAGEKCSTVAQCFGHDSSSSESGDQSNDDNGTAGDTDRNDDNGSDDNGTAGDDNGNDDNGRGESDHAAGHDDGNDNGNDGNDGGNDNDD